jgi:hypothetical protein
MTSNTAGQGAPRLDRYTITLTTSSVPMPVRLDPGLAPPGTAVFRSRVVEDGRDRYRLHLGYFESAEAAQAALGKLRTEYPAALVTAIPVPASGSLDDTVNTSFALMQGPVAKLVATTEPAAAAFAAAPATTLTPGQVARVMAPQRYAVQLDWSLQQPGSRRIPRLGIFRAYRLYEISVTREGRAEHGLRLGFFKNLEGALQVADYVRDAYPYASVVPVSYREYTRASELARPAADAAPAPAAAAPAAATPAATVAPAGAEHSATERAERTILTAEERAMLLPAKRTSGT